MQIIIHMFSKNYTLIILLCFISFSNGSLIGMNPPQENPYLFLALLQCGMTKPFIPQRTQIQDTMSSTRLLFSSENRGTETNNQNQPKAQKKHSLCKKCKSRKIFASKKEYNKHYREEHRLDKIPRTCRQCKPIEIFPSRKEYRAHCTIVHSYSIRVCHKCKPPNTFHSLKEYKKHYTSFHFIDRARSCKRCKPKITFPDRKEYGAHYRKFHRNSNTRRVETQSTTIQSAQVIGFSENDSHPELALHQEKDLVIEEEIEHIFEEPISIPDDIAQSLQITGEQF